MSGAVENGDSNTTKNGSDAVKSGFGLGKKTTSDTVEREDAGTEGGKGETCPDFTAAFPPRSYNGRLGGTVDGGREGGGGVHPPM